MNKCNTPRERLEWFILAWLFGDIFLTGLRAGEMMKALVIESKRRKFRDSCIVYLQVSDLQLEGICFVCVCEPQIGLKHRINNSTALFNKTCSFVLKSKPKHWFSTEKTITTKCVMNVISFILLFSSSERVVQQTADHTKSPEANFTFYIKIFFRTVLYKIFFLNVDIIVVSVCSGLDWM